MKSTGEVMGIGLSFEEALRKENGIVSDDCHVRSLQSLNLQRNPSRKNYAEAN